MIGPSPDEMDTAQLQSKRRGALQQLSTNVFQSPSNCLRTKPRARPAACTPVGDSFSASREQAIEVLKCPISTLVRAQSMRADRWLVCTPHTATAPPPLRQLRASFRSFAPGRGGSARPGGRYARRNPGSRLQRGTRGDLSGGGENGQPA